MQRIYTETITLTTGQVTPLTTDTSKMASRVTVEPLVGNAAASSVNSVASGGVMRQFAAAASPVTLPFSHKTEGNQIRVSDLGVQGTTGDKMLVTWYEG